VDPDKCKEGGKNSICSMGGNSKLKRSKFLYDIYPISSQKTNFLLVIMSLPHNFKIAHMSWTDHIFAS